MVHGTVNVGIVYFFHLAHHLENVTEPIALSAIPRIMSEYVWEICIGIFAGVRFVWYAENVWWYPNNLFAHFHLCNHYCGYYQYSKTIARDNCRARFRSILIRCIRLLNTFGCLMMHRWMLHIHRRVEVHVLGTLNTCACFTHVATQLLHATVIEIRKRTKTLHAQIGFASNHARHLFCAARFLLVNIMRYIGYHIECGDNVESSCTFVMLRIYASCVRFCDFVHSMWYIMYNLCVFLERAIECNALSHRVLCAVHHSDGTFQLWMM